ncbi:hypothetical protein A7982_12278 [Minicystis rosea]|nr:hypothetical protein A7982_12278 [Minicystis rosea]
MQSFSELLDLIDDTTLGERLIMPVLELRELSMAALLGFFEVLTPPA